MRRWNLFVVKFSNFNNCKNNKISIGFLVKWEVVFKNNWALFKKMEGGINLVR
jgi:hypothetical protein